MESQKHELRALARAKWRLSAILTTIMVAVYFGFMLLIAFRKDLVAKEIIPGLSIGIVFGVFTILCAWFLTFIYVQWANRVYDAGLKRMKDEAK